LTVGNIALKKEHSHLETSVKEVELAAQINLGLIGLLKWQNILRCKNDRYNMEPQKLKNSRSHENQLQQAGLPKHTSQPAQTTQRQVQQSSSRCNNVLLLQVLYPCCSSRNCIKTLIIIQN
jgi:hypothetical protein